MSEFNSRKNETRIRNDEIQGCPKTFQTRELKYFKTNSLTGVKKAYFYVAAGILFLFPQLRFRGIGERKCLYLKNKIR